MEQNRLFLGVVFVVSLLVQVFFLDSLYLYGYITPMIYVLFVLIYPLNGNKGLFYFLSFLLGLIVDIFHGTGGINASATLLIAALRYPLLNILVERDVNDNVVSFFGLRTYIVVIYTAVLVFIHHFAVFYLDYLKLGALPIVLYTTLITVFFSLLLLFVIILILRKSFYDE